MKLNKLSKIFKAENMTLKDLQVGVQNGEITKTDLKDMGIATLKQRNEIFYACKKRVFTQQEDNGESGVVEFAINNNLHKFDSGVQGEHKIKRGFKPTITYSAHWISEPSFKDAIENFVNNEEKHINAYVKATSKYLPFISI